MDNDGSFRTFRGYSLADEEQDLTPSMEDYLEMIFRLTSERQYLRLTDLAAALNVQPPSATRMVQRLSESGYLVYEKYGILQLTELGRDTGAQLMARHLLLETFMRYFGVRQNILKDTERIEHIISDEFVDRIAKFVEFAKNNPTWIARFLSE
ncbi:MAG: transcriptional regulator MntR, partial [Bacillota bacterium]